MLKSVRALGIYHAMRMRHIVMCGLSGSTVLHIILQTARFSTELLNIECVR